jgi:hypothetical protein
MRGSRNAAKLDAERLAAREELVRVDFVCPAEEVRFGFVGRGPEDCEP